MEPGKPYLPLTQTLSDSVSQTLQSEINRISESLVVLLLLRRRACTCCAATGRHTSCASDWAAAPVNAVFQATSHAFCERDELDQ
jgi:hypothetical protein